MATGYFKLYRPIRNHWVYSDSRYLHLWLDCLINARWSEEPKTEVYKGVMYTVSRGQFLFSRSTYSKRLNIEEAVVRKAIELMVKDEMIKQVGTLGKNKPTLYEVCNFDKYNPLNDSNSPSEYVENEDVEGFSTKSKPSRNQVETKSKPSRNPVTTTKEEGNKGNKEKKVKKEISDSRFTPPTLDEVKAYCTERNNDVNPLKFFEYFEAGGWKDSKGNKVKNWKQKIITWEKGSGNNVGRKEEARTSDGNRPANTRQPEEWEVRQIEQAKRLSAEGKLVGDSDDFGF